MLDQISYSLPDEIGVIVRQKIEEWRAENKISRLWAKDASLWTNTDEAKWLGWLGIVDKELNDLQKYRDFAEEVKEFKDIVLLGMGGSSLCPEVLAITFRAGNFHVLDSTVPAQVKAVEDKIDLAKTLFIVASKSGSTLEPNCFKQYFFGRVAETVGAENAGKQFVAITDPGSKMQQVAESDGFRRIFFGDPEIGGRFSALSVFGMTAAAGMRLSVERFLQNAREMAEACQGQDPEENPGAVLGLILGVCQQNGRDKLTVFTSPEIYDLGAWMEQLVAESTGKNGVSIIPIDREPVQMPEHYGSDRVFVHLKLKNERADESTLQALGQLERSGHPFITIEIGDTINLGQEFFRWEFATAVAGSVMGINPFDQPDVESAKIEARKITDEYERTGTLPLETPFFAADGLQLFSGDKYAGQLNDAVGDEKTLRRYLTEHISRAGKNDYFALLGYVEMNDENSRLLQELREKILGLNHAASCLGFGPRFLHSTGQAYKGGANNGVFLQITSDDEFDLPVPGQSYTFGVVKAAQARGDFQVLLDRDRRALRVHLGANVSEGLNHLASLLAEV
ncbi:MAG TPA: bifunctional transaldolase/phosoglucose isomerase [Pyrinomonadaceae bacterium]|jgi:transaldolase/glucose-6-phosphate isomerase|nr:bifunctional transaldolase/phosoglucose isomerase [Pyrinomonadaceae bacterium]